METGFDKTVCVKVPAFLYQINNLVQEIILPCEGCLCCLCTALMVLAKLVLR